MPVRQMTVFVRQMINHRYPTFRLVIPTLSVWVIISCSIIPAAEGLLIVELWTIIEVEYIKLFVARTK
jgi:hypothetical protein